MHFLFARNVRSLSACSQHLYPIRSTYLKLLFPSLDLAIHQNLYRSPEIRLGDAVNENLQDKTEAAVFERETLIDYLFKRTDIWLFTLRLPQDLSTDEIHRSHSLSRQTLFFMPFLTYRSYWPNYCAGSVVPLDPFTKNYEADNPPQNMTPRLCPRPRRRLRPLVLSRKKPQRRSASCLVGELGVSDDEIMNVCSRISTCISGHSTGLDPDPRVKLNKVRGRIVPFTFGCCSTWIFQYLTHHEIFI